MLVLDTKWQRFIVISENIAQIVKRKDFSWKVSIYVFINITLWYHIVKHKSQEDIFLWFAHTKKGRVFNAFGNTILHPYLPLVLDLACVYNLWYHKQEYEKKGEAVLVILNWLWKDL